MHLLSAAVKFSEKWNGLLGKLLVEIFLDGRISKFQKRVGVFVFNRKVTK